MRLTQLLGLLVALAACQLPAHTLDGLPADAAVVATPDGPAQDPSKPTLRVLFIGNSYTAVNNLPAVVARLSRAARSPVNVVVGQHTPGGASWENHDASAAVTRLIQEGWDRVVLQDQSGQPWIFPGIKAALRSLDHKIREAGARTLLFMTWARGPAVASAWQRFSMNMGTARYYEAHAAAVGARVVPVGRAWERALRAPGLVLHAADGSHPSAAGTYLAACSFYIALTGESPLGLGNGGLALDSQQLTLLQRAARDTHRARAPPAAPLVGRWPLAAGSAPSDLVPSAALEPGGASGPGAGEATQFGSGRYAGAPWTPRLDVRGAMTLALHAHRDDWSQPLVQGIVGRWWGYQLRQQQGALVAELYTTAGHDGVALSAPLTGLAGGWHHLALTYDGAAATLWIDAAPAATAPASGDIRYYEQSPDEPDRYNGIAIGGVADEAPPGIAERAGRFTGRLADVRLYDRALSQSELRALAGP